MNCSFTKDELFLQAFLIFLTKSVDQSLSDGYFYLLLSLKLFLQKKSVLLELPHLITLLPRLYQSNKILLPLLGRHSLLKEDIATLLKSHLAKCYFNFNCLTVDC